MQGLLLMILSWMRPLFRRLGADPDQVEAIVALKITLDNRRTYTAFGQQQHKQKDRSNSFWLMLLLYAFMGSFGCVVLIGVYNQAPIYALSFSFAIPMLLIGMALISDFSSVLLDSSDNAIILPCPVNGRTLLIARITHICLYLLLMSMAASIASAVVIAIRFGIGYSLLYTVFMLLSALLIIFLTSLLYLLLMRFTSEEKLREAIMYVQIIVAIFFYAGYQVLPRMISATDNLIQLSVQWWHYLLPPVWFGGAMEAFLTPVFDPLHLSLLALAVLTPFVGLWVTVSYLTPLYNQRIASIDVDARPQHSGTIQPETASRSDQLAQWFTGSPLEAAGFALTWRIMLRDRQFKLRAYPSIGYMIVLFFMFVWRTGGSLDDGDIGTSFASVLPLYFCTLLLGNAISLLRYSDQHKAAWVFVSTPLEEPGQVMLGAVKAAIIQLLLPVQVVVSAYVLYVGGLKSLDDVLLTTFVNISIAFLYAIGNGYFLPFSSPVGEMTKGANVARTLVIMMMVAVLGAMHWGLSKLPYGVWAGIPVMAGIAYVLLLRIRNADREKFTVS